jgi:hypothetical protein
MKYYVLVMATIIVAVIVGAFLLLGSHGSASKNQTVASGCASHQFTVGSSGSCVKDIQTLVNFIETDGLTMCPFTGSQALPINGSFSVSTQNQVAVVQTWANCYNRQEGTPTTISTDGVVDSSTWSDLCTYGYQYPKQSNSGISPFLKASITAGKNAGC